MPLAVMMGLNDFGNQQLPVPLVRANRRTQANVELFLNRNLRTEGSQIFFVKKTYAIYSSLCSLKNVTNKRKKLTFFFLPLRQKELI